MNQYGKSKDIPGPYGRMAISREYSSFFRIRSHILRKRIKFIPVMGKYLGFYQAIEQYLS